MHSAPDFLQRLLLSCAILLTFLALEEAVNPFTCSSVKFLNAGMIECRGSNTRDKWEEKYTPIACRRSRRR